MAGVQETAQWENHVYRIEENDPVHGGEEGVTNKPIKHLANRTLYLRRLLTEAGQRINPKKITASSRNSNDLTGHTHEIDLASLTTKGLVQLTNDTGLDSEVLALTAKGGKALAQQIAQTQQRLTDGLNQKPNKSDISSAVNSESTTQIANSKAVKQAYDKAVAAEQLAQTKQAALITHTLDLSALDQDKYYLITFSSSGSLNNGRRWPFSILRPLNNRQNPRWGTHNNGFSLQLYWTSNADGWGTNRLYRTIDTFEYAWTRDNQSPVLSVGQMGRGAFEHCYLRGGTIYWAETLPGFTVQIRTESYTHTGETRQSPIEFSADLVPVATLKTFVSKSEISSAVDSTSETNVANSAAVKTAYDKGVEAKTRADRSIFLSHSHWTENTQNLLGRNEVFGINGGNQTTLDISGMYSYGVGLSLTHNNNKALLYIPHSSSTANRGVYFRSQYYTQPASNWYRIDGADWGEIRNRPAVSSAVDSNSESQLANSNAVKTANDNANGRVAKSGDTMTGILNIRSGDYSSINQWNTANNHARIEALPDGNSNFYKISYRNVDGYIEYDSAFFPRRGMNKTVAYEDWVGSLFLQKSDVIREWYPSFEAGTEVYKIRYLGLMIVVMNTTRANQEILLPEAYTGHAIVLANDRGDGRINLSGSRFLGGNRIKLTGRNDTHCHVLVIGSKEV